MPDDLEKLVTDDLAAEIAKERNRQMPAGIKRVIHVGTLDIAASARADLVMDRLLSLFKEVHQPVLDGLPGGKSFQQVPPIAAKHLG